MGIGTLTKAMQLDYEAQYVADSQSEVQAKRQEKAQSSIPESTPEAGQAFFQEGLTKPTIIPNPETRSDIPYDEIKMEMDLGELDDDPSDMFALEPQPDGRVVIKPNMTKISDILKKKGINPEDVPTSAPVASAEQQADQSKASDPTAGPVSGALNANQVSNPNEPGQEESGDFVGSGATSDRRVADDKDHKAIDQWEMMKQRLRNAGVVSFFIQGFFLMIAMFLNKVLGIKAFSMGEDGQVRSEPMPLEQAKVAVDQISQSLGLKEQDDPNGPTAKLMKEFQQSRKISSEVFLEAVESVEGDLSQSYKDLGEALNQIEYGETSLGQTLLRTFEKEFEGSGMSEAEKIGHIAIHHDDVLIPSNEDVLFKDKAFVAALAGVVTNINETQINAAQLMARYGLHGKKPETAEEVAAEVKLQKKLNMLQDECFALNDAENYQRMFDRALAQQKLQADAEAESESASELSESIAEALPAEKAFVDSAAIDALVKAEQDTPVVAAPTVLPAALEVEKAPEIEVPKQLTFAEMNERQRLDAVTGLIPGMAPERVMPGKPSPYIGNRLKDSQLDQMTVPGIIKTVQSTPTADLEKFVTKIEFKPGPRQERQIDYNPCWISPYIAYANTAIAKGGSDAVQAKKEIQRAANALYRKHEAFKFMCAQPGFDRPVDFKERLIGFEYNMRRMSKSLVALGGMHPAQQVEQSANEQAIALEKRRLLREFNDDVPTSRDAEI